MSKGDHTRERILNQAMDVASVLGLKPLTIGKLANEVGLSKSGLYAHFKAKETIQLQILQHAAQCFVARVVEPARVHSHPISKIQALAQNWLTWNASFTGSCLFLGALAEYDDEPGVIRDFLIAQQNKWLDYLTHQFELARDKGYLDELLSPSQRALSFYSHYLGSHVFHWLGRSVDQQSLCLAALPLALQTAPGFQPKEDEHHHEQ